MPDRFGDEVEDDPTYPTTVEHHPESGWEPDRVWAAEQRRQAIQACGLCDRDGYRNRLVCDHEDHVAAAVRGRRLVTEALQQRKDQHNA